MSLKSSAKILDRDAIVNTLKERLSILPCYVKGVILFGSVARDEITERSDVDLLVLHEGINISDIVERRRVIYKEISGALQGIFPITVIDMELESFLKPKIITSLLLNIYYDAIVILDRTGELQEFIKFVKGRIEKSGLVRRKDGKSYYWILPKPMEKVKVL